MKKVSTIILLLLLLIGTIPVRGQYYSVNFDKETVAKMVASFNTEAATEMYYADQIAKIREHYQAAEVAAAGIFTSKFLDRKALTDLGLWTSSTENYYYRRIYHMVSAKIMPKIWTVAGMMLKSPQNALYWGSYLYKICDETKNLCYQFESIVTNSSLSFRDIAFLEINEQLRDILKLSELGDVDWKAILDNIGDIPANFSKESLQEDLDNLYAMGVNIATAGANKTNEYTLFSEAKKRGESVQSKEKGVPFNWYNWKEYVNRHNPEDVISREDYKALDEQQQAEYKGVRTREVRALFNIDQTTLPFVDKENYEQEVKAHGTSEDREHSKSESDHLRISVNDFILKTRDNLVPIRLDGSGVAHYDAKKDTVYMPSEKDFESYKDFTNELMRQVVSATGNAQRLGRNGMNNGNTSPEDAAKQERLIVELAAGSKMLELGLPAKLSSESMKMVDYWQRELKENPCLIDVVEMDVNNALDMLHKAERGEKVELSSPQQKEETQVEQPKHYFVADELKNLPNKDTKEFVVVRDSEAKKADVVLHAGASLEVDNEIPGMNKGRIEKALRKEGFETISFFNMDGSLGYRPDDSFFAGKDVSVSKLNNWELRDLAKLDVAEAVSRSNSVAFDKVLMLRDDAGKWAMFLKPENEPSFAVYADKADVNRFFVTMKQGNEEASDHMRLEMASRYYAMAMEKPELKTDLFKSQATAEELARIERVNIFKTKATDNKPSVILCVPTIDGNRLQAREVNQQQWQRMWLADDKQDYKTHLAASLFADVLRKERTDAVAVGTDKTEQEAQSETKEQTKNVEAHEEEDKKEEQKEEQTQSQKKQEEEKRRNSPEQKEKERKEEKAKEEATKAETKAVAATVLSPIMKQFLDLKSKHPDAMLLFRTGDFYETYQQDAEKASKILGITLTKSTKQKGPDGNAVKMAGFPYHALDSYLPKLIRAGERVAICDQLEAPKQTGKRGISELVSPGVASEKEPKAEPEKHQAFHR